MATNRVLRHYQRMIGYPLGRRLFSAYAARLAPYFRSVSPIIENLEANSCTVLVRKRKRVQNHIGTMHIIAIANGLEMAMGIMAESSIPAHLRWIPKGMQLEYPAKGETDVRCTASVGPEQWKTGDMTVAVVALDNAGKEVVRGTIMLWISEKPDRRTRD